MPICDFNESTDNPQVDLVMSTAKHALCSDTCWRHTPIDASLQLKTILDIFRNEKCKVIFGVKYISHCSNAVIMYI